MLRDADVDGNYAREEADEDEDGKKGRGNGNQNQTAMSSTRRKHYIS